MTSARQEAAAALTRLAASTAYTDRADAGRALARFLDVHGVSDTLVGLVLDHDNTYVTLETAEALCERHDAAGLAVLAEAVTTADDQQLTYIAQAVGEVYGIYATERDAALGRLDADDAGARLLAEWLTGINPVLHPSG